jgi:hypothetical protein
MGNAASISLSYAMSLSGSARKVMLRIGRARCFSWFTFPVTHNKQYNLAAMTTLAWDRSSSTLSAQQAKLGTISEQDLLPRHFPPSQTSTFSEVD